MRELKKFQKALSLYARHSGREMGPILENRARRLRFELFRQYRSIAPSREALDSLPEQLGYRLKRRKNKKGKPLSVKQEIAARKRSIGWLSLSFLYRTWKSRREGQNEKHFARSRSQSRIGAALLKTRKGVRHPSVRIISFLQAAERQNQNRAIVAKALSAQRRDMLTYIKRKQKEQILRFLKTA